MTRSLLRRAKRAPLRCLLATAFALAPACVADWTVPEAPASCPANGCQQPAPPGWQGPVSLRLGATAADPSCDPGSEATYRGKIDLVAPAASCDCDCDAQQLPCAGRVDALVGEPTACGAGTPCMDSDVPVAAACVSLDASACGTAWAIWKAVVEAQATCTTTPTEVVAPASFGRAVVACSGAALPGCAAPEVCVAGGGATCIHAEGDLDCPAGAFSEKTVAYQAIEDDRRCGDCSCQATPGACQGFLEVFPTGDCSDGSVDSLQLPVTACHDLPLTSQAIGIRIEVTGEPASCQASDGAPLGQATPTGATTFCCRP